MIATMPSGDITAGECVPAEGNSNYLPFCKVDWHGTSGWASSCCIADAEDAAISQPAKRLNLFCTNHQNAGDEIFVQATESNAGWRMRVVHKSANQLYDRSRQYRYLPIGRIRKAVVVMIGMAY